MSDIFFVIVKFLNRIYFSIYVRFWNFYHLHQFKERGCVIKKGSFRGRSFINLHPASEVKIGEYFACNSGPYICITTPLATKIHVYKNAKFTIGNNSGLSAASIICSLNIQIVNIGAGTLIMDTNFHSTKWDARSDRGADIQDVKSAPIIIGDYVFIGARCVICKGIEIGERSIIAAGSIVTKNIPAGEIWGGSPATFHHNLLAHHSNRPPRLCGSRYSNREDMEKADLCNNVIYNWTGEGAYAGEGGSYNIMNNYYKPGPVNASAKVHCRIFTAYVDDGKNQQAQGIYGKFYVNGNYFETHEKLSNSQKTELANANADNTSSTAFCVKNNEVSTKDLLVSLRFPILDDYSFVQSAQDAYQSVLLYAGASNLRDKIDKRIVKETQEGTFTYTGSNGGTNGLIDTQADVEGWSEYASTTTTQQDSDKDGIPDEWETANGLNPNDGSDGNKYNLSKEYTNLEVYLNSLVNSLYPTNN